MRVRFPATAAALPVLGLLSAAAAILPPAIARAADAAPPLTPTRDVVVTYSVQPDGAPQPQTVRVYFGGHGNFMRIDGPPGPNGAPSGDMVMDRDGRTMTLVLNGPRVFMQMPERSEVQFPFVLDDTMRFTRTGSSTVANLPCTTYDIASSKGSSTACIGADGVVLSEQGVDSQGARGHLSAQNVSYAPLPPATFQPPPGFQRVAHPEGPSQNGGPGAAPGNGVGGPDLGAPDAPMPELPPGAPAPH